MMKKNILLALIIILGLIWLLRERIWLAIAPASALNFASITQLPERNNIRDAHFCTEGLCDESKTDGIWPIYQGDFAHFQADFLKTVQLIEPETRLITMADQPDNSFRVLTFSPNFRFPDIIDIQLLPVPDSTTEFGVSVFARALIGKSDLGANKKRLENIRAAF